MFDSLSAQWQKREQKFSAFSTGPLLHFWAQRREGYLTGVDNKRLYYVNFCANNHQNAVVISNGRTEASLKYREIAYDLFHSGYDVWLLDHRGQGFSDRLLADPYRGHVLDFTDYLADFSAFLYQKVSQKSYQHRFLLAHSMGAAIGTLFLQNNPHYFRAAALSAPMFGIHFPIVRWLATTIINVANQYPQLSNYYAIGTSQWRALPYLVNTLTHSKVRYRNNVRLCADYPQIRLGGPTYRWLMAAIQAVEQIFQQIANIKTPLLLLQASEEQIVDNHAQNRFCTILHQLQPDLIKKQVIEGARHEILFEKDQWRSQALLAITDYFLQHSQPLANAHHPSTANALTNSR